MLGLEASFSTSFSDYKTQTRQAGMAPGAVRQEPRQGRDQLGWLEQVMLTLCPTLNNRQPSQVVMCHKETLVPVPALFLGRAHTERRQTAIASEWPTSADLGPKGFQGPDNAARFMHLSLIKMDVVY